MCTSLINLRLAAKTKQDKLAEHALAMVISAAEQKKIPVDTVIEITYVKSAMHNQALITSLNSFL